MRVLVTGANGFVGQHLCRHLRESGDEVVAAERTLPPEGGDFIAVDMVDAPAVRAALEETRPDAIIHLAGLSSVAASHRDPVGTFAVNTLGTVNLLAGVQAVAKSARVLLIGSAEMYGPVTPGESANEEAPLRPYSPYAASKAAAEIAGFQFHRSSGLAVIGVRPFNHLGKGQRRDFVVPSFAEQIVNIKKQRIPAVMRVGDLTAIRDFSHVSDVVEAYRLLLLRGEPGQAYNVCSGEGRSIRALLDKLLALAGVEAKVEIDPARLRPNELPSLVGDSSKLEKLGWKRSRTVEQALLEVLAQADEAVG